jgi:Zn-dependent protease with chaperone function
LIAHLLVVGASLFAYAVAVMVLVPMGASRRRWTSRTPRTALVVWVWALGSGGLALAAGLACVVFAATQMSREPVARITLGQTLGDVLLTLGGYAATAIGGGIGSLLVYRLIVAGRQRRALAPSLAGLSRPALGPRGTAVTIVPSQHAAAVSLPGPHRTILVSSRLHETLTPEQFEAVVEHERCHLRQGHHRLVQLAHLQYKALPILPSARILERSVRMLVELAADDHAARRCGREATAAALRAMGSTTGDGGYELRARRLETVR